MSTRRTFLSLLGLGAAASALPADAVLPPEPIDYSPALKRNVHYTLAQMTKVFASEFHREMAGTVRYRPKKRGATLHHVSVRFPAGDMDDWRAKVAAPAAHIFANFLRHKGVTVLADVPVVEGGAENCVLRSEQLGLCVRGLVQYHVETDLNHLRFDVMAA